MNLSTIVANIRLDPVIRLLAVLVVFFSVLLVYACHRLPGNQQLFTVLSGALTGLVGALLGLVRPREGQAAAGPPPPAG